MHCTRISAYPDPFLSSQTQPQPCSNLSLVHQRCVYAWVTSSQSFRANLKAHTWVATEACPQVRDLATSSSLQELSALSRPASAPPHQLLSSQKKYISIRNALLKFQSNPQSLECCHKGKLILGTTALWYSREKIRAAAHSQISLLTQSCSLGLQPCPCIQRCALLCYIMWQELGLRLQAWAWLSTELCAQMKHLVKFCTRWIG
jgi:hypothetical protein